MTTDLTEFWPRCDREEVVSNREELLWQIARYDKKEIVISCEKVMTGSLQLLCCTIYVDISQAAVLHASVELKRWTIHAYRTLAEDERVATCSSPTKALGGTARK